MARSKCIICDVRPQKGQTGYCAICADQVAALRRSSARPEPFRFLVYRGYVVGMFENGKRTPDGQSLYTPQLTQRGVKGLPKGKTINLDTYVEGLTREQVKKMKRCVLSLAHV